MPQGDPHAYAVAAEENLEKLATELARMGADDNTVNAISQMATVTRKIVVSLGKGQQETGDDEPPAPEEAPEEEPEPQPRNLDEASGQLQQAMQRKEQQREVRRY